MHSPRFQFLNIVVPPFLLGLYLWFAGSYSWLRDFLGIGAVTVVLAWILVRRERRAGSAADSRPSLFASDLSAAVAFGWLLACWVVLSVLDGVFRPAPVPLRGNVVSPPFVHQGADKLRIGLALSGGGYRAALVHAGVLMELAAEGIPVTNIASVSGGSIIGSFVSRGGDPADFVEAVKAGRFRFKRELLSAGNLPRWLLPFGSFSRRDVQASLVHRVLLAGDPAAATRGGPTLMVAMTDLRRGLSIGMTENGFMFTGPTTSRFFKKKEAIALDGLDDLASVVAISGAFPGAFPALQTSAHMTMVMEALEKNRDSRTLALALVDGGVRDNLGLKLLQAINDEARGKGNNSLPWPGFQPGPEWALDLIIVSDGGQSFEAVEESLGLVSQVWRAISLSGLETGILRPIKFSDELPIKTLSIAAELGLSPDAIIVQSSTRPKAAARRDVILAQRLPANALDRIADLVPSREKAREALASYRSSFKGQMNITDLDQRCRKPENAGAAECYWKTLIDLVLDDIDTITAVFRASETLEDQYSGEQANALVRLGRYFVLFKLADIEEGIATGAGKS